MLLIEVMTFGFAWWLGLYLLRRDAGRRDFVLVASGLLVYALALALTSAEIHFPVITPILPIFYALPLFFWLAALWALRDTLRSIPARWRSAESPQTAVGLILVSTITFALGVGLLLFQVDWLPRNLLLIAIGFDMLVLGYAVGVLDAFQQGETLRRDFMRSLLESEVISTLFVAQIGFIWWANPLWPELYLPLLYTISATAVTFAVFAAKIQTVLDRLIFGRNTPIQQERTQLRDMADALGRIDATPTLWDDDAEFSKQVRRALSNLGNLPKLATSPLVRLPLIDQRIVQKKLDDTVLSRSAELKLLLTESINKLKPPSHRNFERTDAWRHYNALYYPYVRGLRPYSARADYSGLDELERTVMAWFQQEIPQRTLYNWQNAGAKLISAELREQLNTLHN